MFVESTDFDVAPYQIPNLTSVFNSFNAYVATKEEEALRQLLGNLLYDEFIDGLEALPDAWDVAHSYAVDEQVLYGNDIWKSLINPNLNHIPEAGANWELVEEANKWSVLQNGGTYDTKYKWVGMKELLKPYIYSFWVDDEYANNTGIGVVKAKAENSIPISPKRKVVRAFNAYGDIAGDSRHKFNTLFGFLTTNSDLYPDWDFTCPGRMNAMGI